MGDNTRKFSAMINSRYGLPEKGLYNQVIGLAQDRNIAKSRAQLVLVAKGLQHLDNPTALNTKPYELAPKKEKVGAPQQHIKIAKVGAPLVHKETAKVGAPLKHKETPKVGAFREHLSELPGAIETQLRPAGDQQSNGDVNTRLAIDKKESPGIENKVGGYIGGAILVGVVIYSLIKMFTIT